MKDAKSRIDLIVSVIPHKENSCDIVDETIALNKKIAELIYSMGYHFVIADSDMISAEAKAKADNMEDTANWIFSGDEEEYDGYYINCSKCGMQRYAYDADRRLDIPRFCPACGKKILMWEQTSTMTYKFN